MTEQQEKAMTKHFVNENEKKKYSTSTEYVNRLRSAVFVTQCLYVCVCLFVKFVFKKY